MSSELSIEFEDIRTEMKKLKPKTVLLQLPSGMKRKAGEIARRIEEEHGCKVIVSGDPCFGACDVSEGAAAFADAIIQVGHAPMPSVRCSIPTLFIPVSISLDLRKLVRSAAPMLTSPVGILVTTQHAGQLDGAKEMLEELGFAVKVGKGSRRVPSPGLVLGCDYSTALDISDSVSSFLIIGGGRFHAIGLKLYTGKPVVILDPERKAAKAEEIDVDAFLRRRHAIITAISGAKSIGVIVSSKKGQERLILARRLLEELGKARRNGRIILMDNVSPEALQDLGFDAYVSTACPRIALDDSERYGAPICTPVELMIALKKSKWEDYQVDEWNYRPPAKGGG